MNIGGILLAVQGAASQGILWGVLVLGVYITYKILDIADLTVDGSFALGGCVCATLVVAHGMNPVLALILATLAGMIAGAVTGFLHTAFDIPAILSGILTQIALWSINLRIMGKSNIPLLKTKTIFSGFVEATGLKSSQASGLIGIIIAIVIIAALYWFFRTEKPVQCGDDDNRNDNTNQAGSLGGFQTGRLNKTGKNCFCL